LLADLLQYNDGRRENMPILPGYTGIVLQSDGFAWQHLLHGPGQASGLHNYSDDL
jgi:hypothetical protein